MAESDNEEECGLNIARRTRSHLKIEDFVPNDNLDFPDVDMKLYENQDSEVDTEYKKFLSQCYSDGFGTETNNDDYDPEYVYNDDIFSHGWRFDLNEVSELHQDDSKTASEALALSGLQSLTKSPRRRIDMFDDLEFARILNQQLRQHIQLLTQTYLLTKNTTNMNKEAGEAKSHLDLYSKIFKHKSKPSNLLPALNLVNNLETPKDIKSSIRLSWRPLAIPDSVKKILHENPQVFIYPSLLPQVAYSFLPEKLIPKKPKINFTINEDKLLAYALNEFKGEASQYAFIASLLMTAKTKMQISNHIKNIKRSPGNENNPIKLYFATGQLPKIDLDSDSCLSEIKEEKVREEEGRGQEEEVKEVSIELNLRQELGVSKDEKVMIDENPPFQEPRVTNYCDSSQKGQDDQEPEYILDMNLDDLIAASTTISKSSILNSAEISNNKNIKNLKLKKSMLNLMSHNFLLSEGMGDLIVHDFLKAAQQKLSERNHLHLLQLLANMLNQPKTENDDEIVKIYREITDFLTQVNATSELHERVVLFLNLEQATKCGCSLSYLHWVRFFEFMQHVELYHDGVEVLEKKLIRLIDALQKGDSHKFKLAIGNLVNKDPFLKREFESLQLDGKSHPSLFICEEDFDDITEPINMFDPDSECDRPTFLNYEHFNLKIKQEELSYASQACPCKCHSKSLADIQPSQHCGKCNLKFMKGRMYLVNKIKPILAEWSYSDKTLTPTKPSNTTTVEWTFEDDREILEFCRQKAEQNEETVSFDTSTFEELVARRQNDNVDGANKRSAREIADRFNQLMDMYRDENVNGGSQ